MYLLKPYQLAAIRRIRLELESRAPVPDWHHKAFQPSPVWFPNVKEVTLVAPLGLRLLDALLNVPDENDLEMFSEAVIPIIEEKWPNAITRAGFTYYDGSSGQELSREAMNALLPRFAERCLNGCVFFGNVLEGI